MKNKKSLYLIIIVILLITAGAVFLFYSNRESLFPPSSPQSTSQPPSPGDRTDTAGLANPASVYCEDQGGKSQIVTAADGSQSGGCVFPDGSRCDEWAFFRRECQKGAQGNFSTEGNYVVIDGRPVFLYEEPGNPAVKLNLFFDVESICDFGQGEGKCNVHQLKSGDRVFIEGTKNKDELTIVKMKRI